METEWKLFSYAAFSALYIRRIMCILLFFQTYLHFPFVLLFITRCNTNLRNQIRLASSQTYVRNGKCSPNWCFMPELLSPSHPIHPRSPATQEWQHSGLPLCPASSAPATTTCCTTQQHVLGATTANNLLGTTSKGGRSSCTTATRYEKNIFTIF